LALKGGQAKGH